MSSTEPQPSFADPAARPIGVFDSGVGGLTVLKAIRALLPYEDLLYLGDTARVPYGNKGPATVTRYALGASAFLVRRDVKALVIACNTASAFGLEAVAAALPIPVIGVIEPVARLAGTTSQTGVVGVIGTRGTVESGAYVAAVQRADRGLAVRQSACPLFVPLAEEGWTDDDVAQRIAERYLQPFAGTALDTLILGCTHYPLLRATIDRVMRRLVPQPVTLLDSATATARELRHRLEHAGALRTQGSGYARYFVTDDPLRFDDVGRRFLGASMDAVEHVDLDD